MLLEVIYSLRLAVGIGKNFPLCAGPVSNGTTTVLGPNDTSKAFCDIFDPDSGLRKPSRCIIESQDAAGECVATNVASRGSPKVFLALSRITGVRTPFRGENGPQNGPWKSEFVRRGVPLGPESAFLPPSSADSLGKRMAWFTIDSRFLPILGVFRGLGSLPIWRSRSLAGQP